MGGEILNNALQYQRDNGWRRITQAERAEAIQWLCGFVPENQMEERDKKILEYFLMNNISAQAIARKKDSKIVCFSNRNKGKPLSTTSILRVIYKYFPNFEKRTKSTSENKRVQLMRKREKEKSKHIYACAFCGVRENLEEHHMIPLFMGGTNDDENLIFLCSTCHKAVTKYQRGFMR